MDESQSQSDEDTEETAELSVSQTSSPARETGRTPTPDPVLAPTTVAAMCRPKKVPKRKATSSATAAVSDRELLAAIEKCDEDKDGLDSFGRSVAAQIRKLDSRRQALAKMKVQQVLYELEFGVETSDSIQSQGQTILQEAMVASGILDPNVAEDAWDLV